MQPYDNGGYNWHDISELVHCFRFRLETRKETSPLLLECSCSANHQTDYNLLQVHRSFTYWRALYHFFISLILSNLCLIEQIFDCWPPPLTLLDRISNVCQTFVNCWFRDPGLFVGSKRGSVCVVFWGGLLVYLQGFAFVLSFFWRGGATCWFLRGCVCVRVVFLALYTRDNFIFLFAEDARDS